jgi:2-oxoglutarate ferredoxin oxidoreductase subunit beta
MLAAMKWPEYPVAVGVIRDVKDENIYDQRVEQQLAEVKASSKITCMDDLLRSGETWEIK